MDGNGDVGQVSQLGFRITTSIINLYISILAATLVVLYYKSILSTINPFPNKP